MVMPKRLWDKKILSSLLVIGLGGLAYSAWHHNQIISNPVSGTHYQLQVLGKQLNSLNQSLADKNTRQGFRDYIGAVDAANKNCLNLDDKYSRWLDSSDNSGANLMKQTRAMCSDLEKLANYSQKINSPLAQIMNRDATPPRFETWGPLSKRMRQTDVAAVKQAVKNFRVPKSDTITFVSDLPDNLRTLNSAVTHSTGTGYLPALHHFQMQVLADNQRFWRDYASLDLLQKTVARLQTL